MERELIYGLVLLGVCVAVLGPPVLYPIYRTHKRRVVQPLQPLTAQEKADLRLKADVDTHVIKRETVQAVGRIGGVAPKFRRTVLNPRRHRYPAELDAPKALRAHDHNTSGVTT